MQRGYTGLHLSAQYCYIRYIADFQTRPKTGITLIKFEAKEQVQDVYYKITKGHPGGSNEHSELHCISHSQKMYANHK